VRKKCLLIFLRRQWVIDCAESECGFELVYTDPGPEFDQVKFRVVFRVVVFEFRIL